MTDKMYKIIDGTAFSAKTPDRVCQLLNYYRNYGTRIRVFYGDTKTGRDWAEEYDTMGRVGRSTGQYKIPLIINNSRSWGGPGLLDECIVRITVDKKDVYRHPKYHIRTKITYTAGKTLPYDVWVNNDKVPHASFKTKEKAEKWARFIKGESNTKG